MAITKTIPAGLFNKAVIFKQPTSSLNDEGGQEVAYSTGITTRAHVTRYNEYRATEADGVSLIGSLDFYIRWRSAADIVDKDWLIEYKGNDYVIHQIEPLDQEQRVIRFTAKSKGTAVISQNGSSVGDYEGGSGGGGGGSLQNFTSYEYIGTVGNSYLNFLGGNTNGITEIEINISGVGAIGNPPSIPQGIRYYTFVATFDPGTYSVRWRKVSGAQTTAWSDYQDFTIDPLDLGAIDSQLLELIMSPNVINYYPVFPVDVHTITPNTHVGVGDIHSASGMIAADENDVVTIWNSINSTIGTLSAPVYHTTPSGNYWTYTLTMNTGYWKPVGIWCEET